MSKSIDDYRNIIKILKLQLLKIREQNATLSHSVGEANYSESSSFTPKINHYSASGQNFAKRVLAFLNFAHRCELIGITPEMIFRVADKKRDKKVSRGSFGEMIKRLKLRMSDTEITQLTHLIDQNGSDDIRYEEYLQSLSAFQVNSEKYPPHEGSRTYTQLCLLKFGNLASKKCEDVDDLYRKIAAGNDYGYLTFDQIAEYISDNLRDMEKIEIVAVFVGLDVNSECQIDKGNFKRQIGKVYSMIERGVKIEEELSAVRDIDRSPGRSRQRHEPSRMPQEPEPEADDDIKMTDETGDQAGAAKKKPKKTAEKKPGSKLPKGDSVQLLNELKKLGVQVNSLIDQLFSLDKKDGLVRSYTLFDFNMAVKKVNPEASKKKVKEIFRALDTESNGTIDTAQLLYIWIRSHNIASNDEMLYRLLYRHLRETQFTEPMTRFEVLGVKPDDSVTQQVFNDVFSELNLDKETIEHIMANYIRDTTAEKLSRQLKSQGKNAPAKQFVKMDKKVYEELKKIVRDINARKKVKQPRWRKLLRLDTGEKSTEEQYWDTIFTDQWTCWEYCLDTAAKLDGFWRDHEFGPTKADPAGIRSIIGNESNPPPGLPDESQITWSTFEQILKATRSKDKVNFMDGDLTGNDVVQGKLGDCWYVSSLSIIASNQEYLKGRSMNDCKKLQEHSIYGVNPQLFKFFIKYGIYVFKYYKNFQPVFVVVDDLFPIETSCNQLIFAKSPKAGDQWVAFLEKSYAKLHHSYSNMISGDIAQGLNDLTNALPIKENIDLGKEQNLDKVRILNQEQQLMGCSISAPKKGGMVEAPVTLDDQKCGLFYGHAYSIIDFLDLKTRDDTFNLIRVRNPWGHGEWILDWSDSPYMDNEEYRSLYKYEKDLKDHYEQASKQAQKTGRVVPKPYQIGAEDGEFMMKFEDFNKIYTNLFTGYNFTRKYDCLFIKESWNEKCKSGLGGLKKLQSTNEKAQVQFVKDNHQYILDVKQDDTDVLMYIIQEDGRLYRGEKYPYKELCNGTNIFSFNLDERNWKNLKMYDFEILTEKNVRFELRREVNLWHRYKKGKYAIIPCKMPNDIEESDFEFRIYYDKPISIKKEGGPNNKFQELPEAKSRDIDNQLYMSFMEKLEKHSK